MDFLDAPFVGPLLYFVKVKTNAPAHLTMWNLALPYP